LHSHWAAMPVAKPVHVGVVGPCKSGKSVLVSALLERGIAARHIAQEHSYVKDMWQRITNPKVLIYLHVTYEGSLSRQHLDWTYAEYLEQLRRLEHAKIHANLFIDTTSLTEAQVLAQALELLSTAKLG
jgi:hypothetical protein